jgi:hypothetical protein
MTSDEKTHPVMCTKDRVSEAEPASDAMKERGLRSSWVPCGCWGCSRFTTKEAP